MTTSKVAGYVGLCRTLAFCPNLHGMAIIAFFVALLGSCNDTVQWGVVHHLPACSSFCHVESEKNTLALLGSFYKGEGPPAPHALLVPCVQLWSTCFPHSIRFPSASLSLHFKCCLVSAKLFLCGSGCQFCYASIFFGHPVRHHFVSNLFSENLSVLLFIFLVSFTT